MTVLRACVKLAGFIAMTLPGLPVQRALIALSAEGARRFPHLYHRGVTRWLDIKLNIIGEPVRDRPCLIASNHVSWLDITVLSAVTPLSFIAKKEVNSWPGFGTLARLQRTVFIDRDRRQSTGSSRDKLQERLKAGETLVQRTAIINLGSELSDRATPILAASLPRRMPGYRTLGFTKA